MKKILLIGYTRKNLGDDLFFNILIHRYKKFHIDIYCPNKFANAFLNAKNVSVINSNFFENDKVKAEDYSLCIYVGGSVFKESLLDIRVKTWLSEFVLKCKKNNIPFYYISSNFGPYKTNEYLELCKNLLKNVTCINFREKYSFDLLKLKNSKYVPDLVFSMKYDKKPTIEGSVGVSLINLYGLKRGKVDSAYFEYMKFLKNNIEKYIEDGKKVYLYSFCSHEKDNKAIDTLMALIDNKYWNSIKTIKYNGNLKSFLNIYSRMEYMLCTRFHAMILSAYFDQKIVVCNYSTKISNVIKDYKLDCEYIEIDEHIKDRIIPLKEYKKCKNVNNIKKLSDENYVDLDKMINKVFNTNYEFDSNFESFYRKKSKLRRIVGKVLRKLKIIKTKKKVNVKKDIESNNKDLLNDCLTKEYIDKNTYNNCLNKLGYKSDKVSVKDIKNGPLVSVIIPTYKRNDYLVEAVDSILNQSYKNTEIIIVDDYVESDLKKIVDKKYKGFKNVIYTKNKVNSKAGKSRQNGYNLSHGKYVIYLDDDDYYIDYNFIEKAVNVFEKDKDINVVGFNSFTYYQDKNEIKFNNIGYSGLCNCLDYIVSFQIEYFKPCPSFTVFRRSVLDENNFKDMKMMNDSSIFLKAMQKGKMYLFNDPIGYYRQHSANITLNLSPEFIIENMEEKKSVYLNLKKNNSISNVDYWWYGQNKLTMKYFIKGSRPSIKKFNKLLRWNLKNMKSYKCKYMFEMIYMELKMKLFRR